MIRRFLWELRRELWENRWLWLAPSAIAVVILAGFGVYAIRLPMRMTIAAAVQGLGVVCAPKEAIEQQGQALVQLTLTGRTVEPRELFAVYPSRRQLPARVRMALDWVMNHG